MTSKHPQKGKAWPSAYRRASDAALSFTRRVAQGRAPRHAVPVLLVAGAALTALVTLLAVGAVPSASGRSPDATLTLGRDAVPVDGAVLLAGEGPARAAPLVPVARPAAFARPDAGPLSADGLGPVAEARALQGRQAGRALLAAYPASPGGTLLPTGIHVFAGAPDLSPPARPDVDTVPEGNTLAQLRPLRRPLAAADPKRPRPRPAAIGNSAAATGPAAAATADLVVAASDRPRSRPASAAMASSAPELAGLRPVSRPLVLSEAEPDALRPSARPPAQAGAASAASLVPSESAGHSMATVPVVPPAAKAAEAASGLRASLRPQTRPAALARLARGALVPDGRQAVAPRAEPFAHTDIARGAHGCSTRLARGIPGRPRGALSGNAIGARMSGLHGGGRDALIVQQALAGNIPDFLRELTPVRVSGRLPGGRRADVTICVTPDYLALGSDADFVRVPMGLPAAARIADRFGFLLPTTRMVDAIYGQARMRLAPRPMQPGAQMSSTRYFLQHNRTVEGQTGGREGQLTAGQKKDLVLTNRLRSHPGRVAIYGWHKPDGHPIQPLSTVHGAYYSDYSHGVRLVSQTAFVDGRPVSLASLLANPSYAQMLTGEGPIAAPERLMASLYR